MSEAQAGTTKFKRWTEVLWPLGGTLLGLLVMPLFIDQYPDFFHRNTLVLPLSAFVVLACWIIPFIAHENSRRMYGAIEIGQLDGYESHVTTTGRQGSVGVRLPVRASPPCTDQYIHPRDHPGVCRLSGLRASQGSRAIGHCGIPRVERYSGLADVRGVSAGDGQVSRGM
jgi:hypothetical protein